MERCWHAEFDVLFIESICDDPVLLKKNYDMKLSNSGNCHEPVSLSDYSQMDPEEARRDFQDRLKQYESIYEPVDEELDKDIPYIKLYNVFSALSRSMSA